MDTERGAPDTTRRSLPPRDHFVSATRSSSVKPMTSATRMILIPSSENQTPLSQISPPDFEARYDKIATS